MTDDGELLLYCIMGIPGFVVLVWSEAVDYVRRRRDRRSGV